jgi:hypothetical protein
MFARSFFIDNLSPVSLLLLPNTDGGFALDGRTMIFSGGPRSLFFKEGILNEIMEMLELSVLM